MTSTERAKNARAVQAAALTAYRTALERVLQAGRLSEARKIAAEAIGASGVVRKGT